MHVKKAGFFKLSSETEVCSRVNGSPPSSSFSNTRGKEIFFLNGVKRRVALSLSLSLALSLSQSTEGRGNIVVMMITTTVIATDGYPHHLHLENHSSLCSATCMTGVRHFFFFIKEKKMSGLFWKVLAGDGACLFK